MSLNIPKGLKREFKKGFDEYIKTMGQDIIAHLPPTSVRCPNCFFDSFQNKSSNIYDTSFKTPVNIFPGTTAQRTIYPAPFNVETVSGVQYDPAIQNPKILIGSICPVCAGEGKLTSDNTVCMKAVVTQGMIQRGMDSATFMDLSAGRDGTPVTRLKTFSNNYPVCRDADYFIIKGIKYKIEIPVRLKGLGMDAIAELYLTASDVDASSSVEYDNDARININPLGQVSNQAPPLTPTIPPTVPGDDVW